MGDERRAGAIELAGVAAGLTEDATTLTGELRAQGRPWGDDVAGRSFAKDYVPAADALSKAVGEVAAALTRIAENLEARTGQPGAQPFGNTRV
ncbi:hypothetical protein [Kibdelosporangium phytohabitans]|nr:hypothetical protein [Kibdelosporangium phytohabitans]MBE1467163.1 hypothetical protein [Kibdelosporangium phytohabitans]